MTLPNSACLLVLSSEPWSTDRKTQCREAYWRCEVYQYLRTSILSCVVICVSRADFGLMTHGPRTYISPSGPTAAEIAPPPNRPKTCTEAMIISAVKAGFVLHDATHLGIRADSRLLHASHVGEIAVNEPSSEIAAGLSDGLRCTFGGGLSRHYSTIHIFSSEIDADSADDLLSLSTG
ncbi:unnamed protein product [Sphacelaria rigidula]